MFMNMVGSSLHHVITMEHVTVKKRYHSDRFLTENDKLIEDYPLNCSSDEVSMTASVFCVYI